MSRRHLTRATLATALALALAGCTTEHEVSEAELGKILFSGSTAYEVDGEPFSGVLLVREGDEIRIRMEMQDGHIDGTLESFHGNGEPRSRAEFVWDEDKKKSVDDGESVEWNEDGQMIAREVADHGQTERKETWCEDGKEKSLQEYDDGNRTASRTWDCETGKQLTEQLFDDQGRPTGEHKQWLADGTLVAHARHQDGEMHGLQESWHANGKPKSRGEYAAGKPTAKHDSWDDQGRLAESGQYDGEGNKTGLWLQSSGEEVRQVHYGPEGFIQPALASAYVQALGDGRRSNAETVAFYLTDGQVKVSDALPASYNGRASSGQFDFPQSQWTYAVVVADPEVLPTLMAHGANLNQADSWGATRLMRCADVYNRKASNNYGLSCSPEHQTELLAKGADAKLQDVNGRNTLHYLVDDTSSSDRTLWGRANTDARLARANAIAELVKAGADVNAADRAGFTPLVLALSQRRADLALALLDNGAKADIAGPKGTLPIHWVFLESTDRYQINQDEFTETMLAELTKRGADVNVPMDWDGGKVTMRDLAMRHGLVPVVKQIDALAGK